MYYERVENRKGTKQMIKLNKEIVLTEEEAKLFNNTIQQEICGRKINKLQVEIEITDNNIKLNNKERKLEVAQNFVYAIRTKKVNVQNLSDFINFIKKDGGQQQLFIKRFLFN